MWLKANVLNAILYKAATGFALTDAVWIRVSKYNVKLNAIFKRRLREISNNTFFLIFSSFNFDQKSKKQKSSQEIELKYFFFFVLLDLKKSNGKLKC